MWAAAHPDGSTWSEILSADPVIIQASPSLGFPLGSASAIGPKIANLEAHFLLVPSWTVEPEPDRASWLTAWIAYQRDFPKHRLYFLGNTDRETELMQGAGVDARTINMQCLVNEAPLYPILGAEQKYDAVYNARLSPQKRIELAAEIDRLALIYFYNGLESTVPQFHAEHARLRGLLPNATFVNQLTENGCQYLGRDQINRVLAQARVGLCLSPVEGVMLAAIEYLYAGLSVVSTPSLGGRDRYFDDEFCLIADADPRSIREAVDALAARAVPRARVRAKVLARVDVDRQRYIDFVQEIIDRSLVDKSFEDRFWQLLRGKGLMPWRRMDEFAEAVFAQLAGQGLPYQT